MVASLLTIGKSALLSNQQVLQTTGNNIANVNTPGYSRQNVLLQSVEGQLSGAGYYGKGVEAETVMRSHSELLTRQVQLTGSVASADSARLTQLKKLEQLFPGGDNALGATVGGMLNAFSDVINAPTDLTARTVVLARADETAARIRGTADNLAGLYQSVQIELQAGVTKINTLAARIADANREIRDHRGTGHAPNDLLDKRDELIRELNGLVQTTSIPASDGTVGIFLASSQALVLGTKVAPVSLKSDEFGDPAMSKLIINRDGLDIVLEEAALGGGSMSGLLRFQNNDLVEAGNLLGRIALGLGTTLNLQHQLGLTLDGLPGGDLLTVAPLPDGLPAAANTGTGSLQVAIVTSPANGAPQLAASDYEVTFTGAASGAIRRLSDGQVTAFAAVPVQVDGLQLQLSGTPAAGDRFRITPLREVAAGMDVAFASPRALAVASPVVAAAGTSNRGSLSLQGLLPQQADPNLGQTVTITFTGAGTFDVSGTGTGDPTGVAYVPGQSINYNGWSLTLKGTPQAGDTFTVRANAFPGIDAGNAQAMLAIRDRALFDGAAATDGYAALIGQLGVRVQSAGFASAVSQSIASSAVADNAALAGVNLDEEAAKLLQFQQAYQASAKIMQVSQSIFDTLLQNLGR